jgi:protein TonB
MINKRHWIIALFIAFTLHAAAFFTFASTSKLDDSAKDKGKSGIEIDLGMLGDLGLAMADPVVQEVVTEKEPEPEVEPEIQPPEVVEPLQAEPESIPEPVKLDPKPIVQKNDVHIKTQVKPPEVKKVKEKKKEIPKEKPKPIQPVQEKTDTTAKKSAEKPTSSTSTARDKKITTGSENTITTGGQKGAERSYFAELSAKLARHKRYPNRARRLNEEGIVVLFFVVNRTGNIIESHISKSSGYSKLDDAVLRMLKKSSPLPAFPDEMEQSQLSINIPISFKLNDKY